MYRVIRAGELRPSPGGTVTFEGDSYGSGVSFFLVDNEPGAGPDLHRHPYHLHPFLAPDDPGGTGRVKIRALGPRDDAAVRAAEHLFDSPPDAGATRRLQEVIGSRR